MAKEKQLENTLLGQALGADDTQAPGESQAPVSADLSGFLVSNNEHGSSDSLAEAYIGRYQIIRKLGQGGFGVVFLAKDSDLDRLVAIKLPHIHRMRDDAFRKTYLQEARTLAKLDHPSIVPIFDCGTILDGRCFVVSKYIEGQDLSRVLADRPLEPAEVARLLAAVAEALHHVHQARIVHRDIKPANLMLGDDGRIYVADFGLALREDPSNTTTTTAGTPNYMSPEQVRGEGHRVDGRSDQFSLGVVMYELLTGERPFSGGASQDVLHRIQTLDPVPPRQLNRTVPFELNRICLKLLSKLASQRYAQTIELAHDLLDWLGQTDLLSADLPSSLRGQAPNGIDRRRPAEDSSVRTSVIPRGLRAFTRADAYFFLDLLPGTRDRDGLPMTVSHWKRWVTARDEVPDLQRVGVISGPTGCGKSSLVRAGLIPLLSSDVVTVIVEATADLTERQLLAGIDRRCSEHSAETLPELLASIRRGGGLREGKSLLLIIDQFEQWLHAHPDPLESELVRAIRQCDGIRVQCLLLIRDDFWLALCRFMEAVESPLQLGRNAMMIDLFDLRHATRVLTQFGRGYGQLPEVPAPLSRDQERFIEGAIGHLAIDGKVYPVQLALFAEMVKSRDWLPATLRQLGGAVGIGAQFLNESFSVTYAPAGQRAHEVAARKILQALLPDLGTEIKASQRPRSELLTVSGYEGDRSRFDMLMTLLESDLKLISATESLERTKSESNPLATEQATYQLSHDFLVPSIREWLTAKQRESWRGRLQQRLSEQASLWNRQQDARFLPNFWEWLQMRCWLPKKSLSAVEKKMLVARDRRSLLAVTVMLAVMVLIGFGWHRLGTQTRIDSLVEQLGTADPQQLPQIIGELAAFGPGVEKALVASLAGTDEASPQRFVLQMARLKWNPEPVENVFAYLLASPSPEYVPVAIEALLPHSENLKSRCWELLEHPTDSEGSVPPSDDERFRAAQLLAKFDPPTSSDSGKRWKASSSLLAELLVSACTKHPDQYAMLAESLLPASTVLIEPLSKYLGTTTDDSRGRFAISLLETFSQADAPLRTRLCLDTSDWQKEVIVPESGKLSADVLWAAVRAPQSTADTEEEQNRIARRRAMATALLLSLPAMDGSDELWNQLRRSPDSTARSHLIRQLSQMKVPLSRIVARLRYESDPGVLYALVLALGDYPQNDPALTSDSRTFIADLYRNATDAGVHSAVEWLLRQWGDLETISSLPAETRESAVAGPSPPRQWMLSPKLETINGHTLVRIDGTAHPGIRRDFLIAAHEVTVEQIKYFDPNQYVVDRFAPTADCPAHVITWPKAVAYCNWLSKCEGLPAFYPTDPALLEDWRSTQEHLSGTGYRLPTAAEWEYASRAGSANDRYFGADPELTRRYAWYEGNNVDYLKKAGLPLVDSQSGAPNVSSKPVGLLRPNDWGLFDVYGNIEEWCDDPGPNGPAERAIRGGSTGTFVHFLDSSQEGSYPIMIEYNSLGFRVARTVTGK